MQFGDSVASQFADSFEDGDFKSQDLSDLDDIQKLIKKTFKKGSLSRSGGNFSELKEYLEDLSDYIIHS